MKNISIGKLRGLQQISTNRGTITVLALDHRQNLRKANPVFIHNENLSRFKLDVTSALATKATAILLDPEVAAAQAISKGVIPKNVGLVVALELTGYTGEVVARQAQIIPGWSVEKAKHMGASAVKLLVYYHPDSTIKNEIEEFVSKVAADCTANDIVLMLEPLSYSLNEGVGLSSDEKRYVVTETAKRLSSMGIDILKAEFPLDINEKIELKWTEACLEISNSCITPWILLSAAVDFDTYQKQVVAACNAGASGAAVGRAVWQEFVTMTEENRVNFLNTTARRRLSRLTSLCHALAKPYTDFFQAEAPFDWYKSYEDV